ncbi:MAG: SSS family solute:Na+ symporter [Limisphaerales bacterium]|jgi:SSS family solute:Na+ symporter
MTAIYIIAGYLVLLLLLGVYSNRSFKGTSRDYFLASRGIGPFLLLMSLFGTTMTAFALVGSTGASFKGGIGIYGKLASSSGIIHSLCFFVIGIKLWSLGAKHGYMTQIQFFRDRFNSDKLGLLLFPIIVGLVVPYLLVGILGAGSTLTTVSEGKVSFAAGSGAICVVVLIYVFSGGVRGTAWANCFQTLVFIALGIVTFFVISTKLGGFAAATQAVIDNEENAHKLARIKIPQLVFFSYMLIPLSVGMFPHIFQHWLTAKSANSFKLAVVAHPLLIMLVWVPCVLIGTWATSAVINGEPLIPTDLKNANDVLGIMVLKLSNPVLGGFLTAGIMAAIMSSLDSQFLCIGSMFTNDIYLHYFGKKEISEKQKVLTGRIFVVAVVLVTYLIALYLKDTKGIFTLGVWCFSGFSALFPLIVAALYWKRVTTAGAFASILAAAVSWIWLFANSNYGSDRSYIFLGMMPVATMIIASTLALVVVSLVTRPPDESTLKKFF